MSLRGCAVFVFLLGLAGCTAFCGWMMFGSRPRPQAPASVSQSPKAPPAPTSKSPKPREEAEEPCRIEGPPAARQSFAGWCDGGLFTVVNVSASDTTIVVIAQFSAKGHKAWLAGKRKILGLYEPLVAQVAAAGLDAAVSFHNPSGQMVGGCAQRTTDPAPVCRGN